MKTLAQQMAIYAAYHRNPWNRLTHAFGVPLITFCILLALSWLRLPLGESGFGMGALFTAAVWAYYVMLDMTLALAILPFVLPLLYAADLIAVHWGTQLNAAVFAGAFLSGITLQLVGHAIEGRRPASADNFMQVFVAPIFLLAELGFMLGLRLRLKEEVDRLSAP